VLLIAVILYVAIAFALQTVRVDGESMVNTLQNQDLLLASKISYDFGGNPQRGDIVILIPPTDPTQDFIKRVIGLPGDIIEIDGGKTPTEVLIKPDGQGPFQMLKEPYLPEAWTTLKFCCNSTGMASSAPQPLTIPSGEYFVMGDNRNFSSDSRVFGLVPRKNILAKAILRIWPLDHFGGLGTGPTLEPVTSTALAIPALGIATLQAWRWRRRRMRRLAAARHEHQIIDPSISDPEGSAVHP
jgi:signal peptidase I